MNTRYLPTLAGTFLASFLLLSGCGSVAPGTGEATASATPTAAPTLSPADAAAITTAMRSLYGQTGVGPCVKPAAQFADCPVNPRLGAALGSNTNGGLCRCQNPWQSAAISAATVGSDHIARVDLYFGQTTYVKLDLYMASDSGRWLATDIRCRGGDVSTSIFASAPPTCEVHT